MAETRPSAKPEIRNQQQRNDHRDPKNQSNMEHSLSRRSKFFVKSKSPAVSQRSRQQQRTECREPA